MEKTILLAIWITSNFIFVKYEFKKEFNYEKMIKNCQIILITLMVCILSVTIILAVYKKFRIFYSIAIIFYIAVLLREKRKLKRLRENKQKAREYAQKIRLEKMKRERPEDIIDV